MRIPRYNTVTYEKHSIRYLGPYLWRKLLGHVRTQCDLNSFKRQLRKWTWKVFCSKNVQLAVFHITLKL